MIVRAKSSDARPLNTGTSTQEKVSHPDGMVNPTLNTPAPNVSRHVITKCGEDLFKDSQPSAAASKAVTATPQSTSMSSTNNYQVLKLSVNGKLQNYLVSMNIKKPSSNTSEPMIAYGPFDFVGGKMTSAAVNHSQTGSAATSVKYPDNRPASTNQSVVSKASPAVSLPLSLAKPGLTQNTTVNQLTPIPTLMANNPVVVTSKHSMGTSASATLANLASIVPTSMSHGTTIKAPGRTASKILASYSQNRLTRPSDKHESSVRTLHSSISSLMSRPANIVEPNTCNLMTTKSISSTCSFSVSNAPLEVAANCQTSGLEMGGTLVKGPLNQITYIAKDPTSITAKSTTYTTASIACSKPQSRYVVLKDAHGKIIGIQTVALTKQTGAPSGVASAVDANASAVQPIPCTTFVSSNSTTAPRLTTVNVVNASYQKKPDEVSEHCLKIDSVYSLAEQPAPVTVKSVKTGGSTDPSAPGHSLSECNDYTEDSTAESPILASEQPAFLEVIDVDPCKVVIRKISHHFPTNITKKNFNKLNSTCNLRKRPWSKFVREHLSSYFRKEKFAKSELNPDNVYKILQESPLTVVAMPMKAVQTDKVDNETEEKVYQRPQTARKRGHGRKNSSRSEDVTDNVLKKPKLSSANNEDPDPLSRPRPLLMTALRTTPPPLLGCSVAKSTATRPTPVCSVARSIATPQMPVFSFAQSTATPQRPVCSVVSSTAVSSTPKYRSIINPAVVSPKKGTVDDSATIMLPNKCVVKSQNKSVDSMNALKSVHPTPTPALQKDKALPSGVQQAPGLSEMFGGETKKFSLPVGPCVTAGFTGKAVLPGKDGCAPENYLILRTSESCYFVPVGKNAYVIPISKATGVIQSCKKPVMSTACFGDVASVSESRAMKVASQVTTMPILTAEADAPRMTTKATHYHDISKTLSPQTDSTQSRMTTKATHYHDISKTLSPQTDSTQSKTSFPPEMSQVDDNLSKSGTNNGLSGVRIKSEPVTTGYPGDPGDEPPRLSPAPSPVPGDRIKTEHDSETDDAWSGTEMPDEEAPSEEEASNIHFKSVADLYRSRQSQYQLTDDYQASEEDEEAAIRAERIRKLRDLLKAKEIKCDKARQRWSGDKTEKLIKDFDDI